MVAYPTGNKAKEFQGQKSRDKVTTSTNAEIESASYLPNAKAYELQIWYRDVIRRPVSSLSAMISKVKGQGCKVTSSAWRVLADKSRMKRSGNTLIATTVAHPTCNNAHQF